MKAIEEESMHVKRESENSIKKILEEQQKKRDKNKNSNISKEPQQTKIVSNINLKVS